MRKHFSYLFIILFLQGTCQDIHFSHYFENPSMINPALTGAYSPLRVTLCNRDQWRSVNSKFQTIGATIDTRFSNDNWEKVKNKSMTFKEKTLKGIAAGLAFYNDKAGDAKFEQSRINLSIATFVPINHNNIISIGIQNSLVQRRIDYNALLFPNQYNGLDYVNSVSSGESINTLSFLYHDVAAGINWAFVNQNKEANKIFKINLGVAAFQLTKPKNLILNTQIPSYIRYVLYADMISSIGETNIILLPSLLSQFKGTSTEIMFGTFVKHYLNTGSKYTGIVKRNSAGYGLHYRLKDAVSVSGLLELKETLSIILSYDINVSALRNASLYRGGMELTLKYAAPKSFLYQRRK